MYNSLSMSAVTFFKSASPAFTVHAVQNTPYCPLIKCIKVNGGPFTPNLSSAPLYSSNYIDISKYSVLHGIYTL